MRLDRVRHQDHPVAPATKVAAPVAPPTRLLRSAFLQAWNDGLVVIVFIRSSDKYTLPLGLQPSPTNGTDSDRSWRSPCSCSIRPSWSSRPGRRHRSRWTPLRRRGRALPVTPPSRLPLRARRRSRRLRRRRSPTAEGSGPHRVGAAPGHRPGPVVHRRFHRAVGEGHPGGADTKGTTAGPTTTNGHQPMNTHPRPHPRMRPDHDCYEYVPPTGTPLDGDWFT